MTYIKDYIKEENINTYIYKDIYLIYLVPNSKNYNLCLIKKFPSESHAFFMEPFTILISSTGRSFLSVSTSPILFTIAMPEKTLPVK